MSEKVIITKSSMDAIGDAIRDRNGLLTKYLPSEMPAAIEAIPNSYIAGDEGKVVSNGALVAQTPRASGITENGTYDTTENNSVVVNVPTGSAVVQSLSVTQNGTYNPPSGVDGYAPVTVNVPSGGGSGDEPTVYWGDEAPLSSLGNDGDVYIRGNIYVFRDSGGKVLRIVNKDYVVTSTSQILSNHGGSGFQKTVEGPAIAIECLIDNRQFYDWKGPVLISTVEDYVKYTGNTSPWGHVDVDDVTWYIGSFNNYNSLVDSPTIPTYYDFAIDLGNVPSTFDSTYASALVRKFLELAAPSLYGTAYVKINGTWEIITTELNLEALNVTNNGVYVPSIGKDGFSNVTVNVSGGGSVDDWTGLKNYIESNGTQWINTGYSVKDNSKFEVIANPSTTQPQYGTIFGTRDSNSDNPNSHSCILATAWSSNLGNVNWGSGINRLTSEDKGKKTKYFVTKSRGMAMESESVAGIIGFTLTNSTQSATNASLLLFTLGYNGADYGSITHCNMKLYRFRIYEDDMLVHEYLPWQENGVVCLKDTITGDFLYNAGTGGFVYGTDK